MADVGQPNHTRSSNAPPRTPLQAPEATRSLSSLLDDVHPPERRWTFHQSTGVIYHAENTKCDDCVAYIKHLQSARRGEEPSLLKAIRELENSWLKRLDEHPVLREQRNNAYRDGIAEGRYRERGEASEEGRARVDSGKNKARMSQAELDLEDLQTRYDDVVRANAVLVAEKRVLETENKALLTQVRTFEREFERFSSGDSYLSASTGVDVPTFGTGIPFVPLEDQDVLMEPVAGSSTGSAGNASSSYAAAVKRKPTAPPTEGQGPVKRPKQARMTFRDPRTNLPVPLHPGGNPHFDGGAWREAINSCPGETLDQKIRWLCGNRHLPLFKRVLGELREFVRVGGYKNLGPHQKAVWRAKDSPWSLRELALANPSKAHPGVRWNGSVPNDADLVTWSLVRCLNAGRSETPGRRSALREALAQAVEDLDLWGPIGTQSSGLNPAPLDPSEDATPDAVARHLVHCGVTRDYVVSIFRPFMQRAHQISSRPSVGSSPGDAISVARHITASGTTSIAASAAASTGSPVRDAEMAEAGSSAVPKPERGSSAN